MSRPLLPSHRSRSKTRRVVEVQSPSTCNIKKKSVQPNVQEIPASTGQLVTPSYYQKPKSTEGCDASGEFFSFPPLLFLSSCFVFAVCLNYPFLRGQNPTENEVNHQTDVASRLKTPRSPCGSLSHAYI